MKKDKDTQKPEQEVKEQEPSKEEQLAKELADKSDQFLRLYAEFDNFRKRSIKEKQDIRNLERADMIKQLLPVIDNFGRAKQNDSASLADYRKGIELIFTQLSDILTKQGVEPFGEAGDVFDPQMHNAVMHIDDESLGENVVAEVFSKGYKLGDTVIRFAAVKVAN